MGGYESGSKNRDVEQLEARRAHNPEAADGRPLPFESCHRNDAQREIAMKRVAPLRWCHQKSVERHVRIKTLKEAVIPTGVRGYAPTRSQSHQTAYRVVSFLPSLLWRGAGGEVCTDTNEGRIRVVVRAVTEALNVGKGLVFRRGVMPEPSETISYIPLLLGT